MRPSIIFTTFDRWVSRRSSSGLDSLLARSGDGDHSHGTVSDALADLSPPDSWHQSQPTAAEAHADGARSAADGGRSTHETSSLRQHSSVAHRDVNGNSKSALPLSDTVDTHLSARLLPRRSDQPRLGRGQAHASNRAPGALTAANGSASVARGMQQPTRGSSDDMAGQASAPAATPRQLPRQLQGAAIWLWFPNVRAAPCCSGP